MREHGLSLDQAYESLEESMPAVGSDPASTVMEGIRKVGLKIKGD
jgi:hypothetical protein